VVILGGGLDTRVQAAKVLEPVLARVAHHPEVAALKIAEISD